MSAPRVGDTVYVDGVSHIFIGEKPNGMYEVGRDGQTEVVPPRAVNMEPPDSSGDPFDGLLQQLDGLISKLKRDTAATSARLQRRKLQVRKLEQVVRMLRAVPAPPAGQKHKSTLPCGHWPTAKAHQTCKAEKAGVPV